MEKLRSALLILLALGCSPRGEAQTSHEAGPPAALTRAFRTSRGPVEAERRHVRYHVDDHVIHQIEYLRGALLPTRDDPPWFDDPGSFAIAIDTGVVTISPASLTA